MRLTLEGVESHTTRRYRIDQPHVVTARKYHYRATHLLVTDRISNYEPADTKYAVWGRILRTPPPPERDPATTDMRLMLEGVESQTTRRYRIDGPRLVATADHTYRATHLLVTDRISDYEPATTRYAIWGRVLAPDGTPDPRHPERAHHLAPDDAAELIAALTDLGPAEVAGAADDG